MLAIGRHAFPIIGCSFLPAVVSLMMPVFFQAIGYGRTSLALSLLRQIVCLLPLFWLLASWGWTSHGLLFRSLRSSPAASGCCSTGVW